MRSSAILLVLPVALLAGWATEAPAQLAPAPPQGRQWAVLIGVEKYQKAVPLRYIGNDVRQLAETLRTHGGYAPECIVEITDRSPEVSLQPRKAALLELIPEWLKKPAPEDQVIVYFSGHGFRDSTGKMYLAPIECDPANPAATGIPVAWFREQIAACPAVSKLLVIDACHAGSEKGEDTPGLAAETLGEGFKGLEKVVTLASSTAEQKSQIWPEKQQSLFSYWLVQGLKGNADKDGDGNVDIDELYDYVNRTVPRIADNLLKRRQNPVRSIRIGVTGVPVVLRLKPLTLRQLLTDMAELVSDDLLERKIAKVGVLEFANDSSLGKLLLGGDFGLLGRYCAEEFEKRLADRAAGKFTVVSQGTLKATLKDLKFTVDDVNRPDALSRLSQRVGGMPVIALATFRSRVGQVVTVQCKLLETADSGVAGATGGTALLNENEWGMLGRSAAVRPEDRMPQPPIGPGPPASVAAQVVKRLDERSEGPHPLQGPNPAFPFRIKILIGGQERVPVFRGNQMFVGVRIGEVYEVYVENLSRQIVHMRLLVDGLNTLPELDQGKGVATWLIAPRVNLDSARTWIMDPAESTSFTVRGFVTETGVEGKLNEFKVVDIADSVAARQQFTDQVGIITAAFYTAVGARAPATGFGKEKTAKLVERAGLTVGDCLGTVHIRYVDADALAAGKE